MALTAQLSRERLTPKRIRTDANVKLERVGGDTFSITEIELVSEAEVSGIDDADISKLCA